MSAAWPLAFEEGDWAGHLGSAAGPAVIGGRYAAQWVKRDGRWLIRERPACPAVLTPSQWTSLCSESLASIWEARMGRGGHDRAGGEERRLTPLLPVRLLGGGSGVIEIAMPGGVVVRVDRDVDLKVLDRVLAALR